MRTIHGSIALELPDGWHDRSTLLFVDPQALAAPLSGRASPGVAPPNLGISFAPVPTGPLAAYLDAETAKNIAPHLPGFSVLERGDAGDGATPYIVYRANPGQPICQMVGAHVVGAVLVLVTGGALEAQRALLTKVTLTALRTLGPAA